MVPHNRPLITLADRAAVDEVLASGWIAQGPAVKRLEAAFVTKNGGGYACAVSSGTAALFLALKAMGADAGATVAVPTYACSALLNAVHMCRATPLPVDVLPDTFCLDPEALATHVKQAEFAIAVHSFGAPADVATIRKPGRYVIEDCCQALGGEDYQRLPGNKGDAAVFSFYATKIVTGGQGGMIWSRDADTIGAATDYRQFDCRETYVPRFNFQLTDIQAAMIGSQMSRLTMIRERRQAIAATYLGALPPELTVQSGLLDHGRMVFRFVVVSPDREIRDRLQQHLAARDIGSIVPLERYELLHRYLRLDPGCFPVAERLADTTLSLPIYPGMSQAEVEYVTEGLGEFRT